MSGKAASPANRITAGKESWKKDFEKNGVLYLLFLPLAIYFIIFNYIPMGGILMAFENFKIGKGIFGSEWVWFDNFQKLFSGSAFPTALRNTVAMAVLSLVLGFLPPIILASCRHRIMYISIIHPGVILRASSYRIPAIRAYP